jgi:hypothetical protein
LVLLLLLAACSTGGPAGRPVPCETVVAVWAKVDCPDTTRGKDFP